MNAIKAQLTELRFSVCSDDVLNIELSPCENHMDFHNEQKNGKDFFHEPPTEVLLKIRLLLLEFWANDEFWANFGATRIFGLTKILLKMVEN